MPDNFNSSYLAVRGDRQKPLMDSMLSELDQMVAQDSSPKAAPPVTSSAPAKSSPGVLSEVRNAVGGGVYDAARNTWNLIDDAATWLDNNFLDLRMGSSTFGTMGGRKSTLSGQIAPLQADKQIGEGPEWLKNQTTAGQVGRSVAQFVVPFLGATKALRYAAPVMGRAGAAVESSAVVRGMTAGAATDFAAFDPHAQRLSNLLVDMSDSVPALKNPITEYLAAKPGDSSAEGRLKNTLEGMGIGIAAEGLFKGLAATKSHFMDKGQDPVEAIQAAAQERAKTAAEVVQDATKGPEMPLHEQINLLTGMDAKNASAARRMDSRAAFGPGTPAFKPGVPQDVSAFKNPADLLKQAEEATAPAKTPYRPVIDTEDGGIIFTREAPTPTQLDLGMKVKVALFKAPHERDASDLVALRAYRQMQETAFPGIVKPGADEAPVAAKPLIVEDSAGTGKAAFTDEERKALTSGEEAPDPVAHKVGDTAHYKAADGSPASGEVVRVMPGGKVMVRDDATGALKAVTPAADDPLLDAIRSNNTAISESVMRQQGGFISPNVLAHMASAQAGGLVGWNSAEDDASFADKLSLAGFGALAGMGVKVGASKVLSGAERKVIETASPEVRSLSRREVGNIAPLVESKKAPVITNAKVNQLVEAAKEGGMESLARAAREADFNFNHIDTSEDVKNTIDTFSSVFEKEASLAKHGTQSDDAMKELADELGAGVESLKGLYQGTNNLGARILAHRALLTASAEKVTQLSRLAMTGDSDGILSLRKQVALHASIQAQMKGIQTEVGRALSQFRITSSSIDLAVNERNQLIDAMGGHAANIRFAQQLSEITDPAKLAAVTRKGATARTQDALYEAWVNGLLSTPATHVANLMGNSIVAIGSVAERGTAAMIGKVLRTGKAGVDAGEMNAHLFGMMEGLLDAVKITKSGMDAVKRSAGEALHGDFGAAERVVRENSGEFGNAWRAFAEDAPILDNAAYGTKQMDLQQSAISAAHFGLDQQSVMGRVADGLGALIRTPGRLLTTSDELFKTIHYRGELKAQAYRKAKVEGLEGDSMFQRVAQLIEDPTPEMRAQALGAARDGTFTSPLGKIGGGVQSLVGNTPGLRYIVPFVRTPTNIMKYVGIRTPGLNLLSSNVRAELAVGGARRDMMLAKTTLGATLYALGAYMAAQGYIVGGGEKNRAAEKIGGEQPYSVKAGDTYYSFSRLDPVGMVLGLSADFTDISGHLDDTETDNLASAAVLAISRNLMSKSYLSGLVSALDAISQQDGKMDKFMKNMAGSAVPGIVNLMRKEDDPTAKEVWTLMDAVKARVPGFSKDVPPQVNLFGEDVVLKGGLGPDIASPIMTSQEASEPAAREIARLNIDLKHPPKTLGGSGGAPGVDLSPQQYYRYMKLLGNEAKFGDKGFRDHLNELVQSDYYKSLPEDPSNTLYQEAKEKVIRVTYERYKRLAVAKLLEEDPELQAKFMQNLKNSGNALSGQPILPF